MEACERFGAKTFMNGDRYEGQFKGNLPDGRGEYFWADGAAYEGDWELGRMSGNGKISWSTGGAYAGEFSGGFFNGFGTFTTSDGSVYVGCWRMNVQHGLGKKHYFKSSETYEGSWRGGVRDGAGKYSWSDNSAYAGDWKAGRMSGRGCMTLANGDSYDGNWLNGFKHGSGVYRFSGGGYYFGTWSRGLKDGKGTFYPNPPLNTCCRFSSSCQSDHLSSDNSSISGYEIKYAQGELIHKNTISSDLHRRSTKSGALEILKGNTSYRLMLNLQLGIRYTVGKINPIPRREVRCSDFGERARIRMFFPRKGSQRTPSHSSISFRWKDYCPMVFRNLREMFRLDAADYMMSICGDGGLREVSSSGKSGSLFYRSLDDRFVIKTLKKHELKILLRMLPEYYKHVGEHENTLITKFFGVHRITLQGWKTVRFVVMGNMFCTDLRIHGRYDLKGSSLGRCTPEDKVTEQTTLKDLDLSYEFHMDECLRDELFKQVLLDCKLLESQHIVDYSFLLGLHFRAPRSMNSGPEGGSAPAGAELVIPPHSLLLATHEPSSAARAPGPHIRGKAFSVGGKEVDLLLPETGRVQVQLGVNMPARANLKVRHEAGNDIDEMELFEAYDVVLYLGIIDILQEYNLKKKMEHAYKAFKFDPLSISVAAPKMYAERFISFLHAKVFPEEKQLAELLV